MQCIGLYTVSKNFVRYTDLWNVVKMTMNFVESGLILHVYDIRTAIFV
jgi:hypothetical protein